MTNILVLCTGNSCRSQMAEGWLRHYGGEKVNVCSAGIETHGVNPVAIQVMKEQGVDISGHTSDLVDQYLGEDFDYVITVCDNARERCPVFPSKAKKLHQNFPDPAKVEGREEEKLDAFRKVRDEIELFCRFFLYQHNLFANPEN